MNYDLVRYEHNHALPEHHLWFMEDPIAVINLALYNINILFCGNCMVWLKTGRKRTLLLLIDIKGRRIHIEQTKRI